MVRCAACNTVQIGDHAYCQACGAALGSAGSAGVTPAPADATTATLGASSPPSDPTRGLKIAGLVGATAVLVAMVTLVVVLVAGRRDSGSLSVDAPSTATPPSPTAASTSTTSSSGNAAVTISAASATVTAPAAITVHVGFAGNTDQVLSTVLAIGGVPSGDSGPGLRDQFTVPTGIPGNVELKVTVTLKDGRSIESNAVTVNVVAPTTRPPVTVTVTSPAAAPTLGQVWGPYQEGYGQVRPSQIFNGGDPTGLVDGVVWQSWGGERATGTGNALYVGPNQIVAEGTRERATVVAFDLGPCNGRSAYRSVVWFFPGRGQTFNPGQSTDICP